MGSLLISQIRSYVREASLAAAWQASHHEAMACRDVEDLIAVGLALLETAETSAARPLPPDTPPDRVAAIRRDYWELGRDFDAHFDRIAPLVKEMEQRGFQVEGADRLRDARGFLKAALSVTPQELAEAEEDIRQGRVVSAAEVRDGIRRRLQQDSKKAEAALNGMPALVAAASLKGSIGWRRIWYGTRPKETGAAVKSATPAGLPSRGG